MIPLAVAMEHGSDSFWIRSRRLGHGDDSRSVKRHRQRGGWYGRDEGHHGGHS